MHKEIFLNILESIFTFICQGFLVALLNMLMLIRHWSYTVLTVHLQLNTNKNSMLRVTKSKLKVLNSHDR